MVLRLIESTSERYKWSIKTKEILYVRNNMIVFNGIGSRSSFTPSDGTLRINSLSRSDGGEYTLRIFHGGTLLKLRTLNLTIQGK